MRVIRDEIELSVIHWCHPVLKAAIK